MNAHTKRAKEAFLHALRRTHMTAALTRARIDAGQTDRHVNTHARARVRARTGECARAQVCAADPA